MYWYKNPLLQQYPIRIRLVTIGVLMSFALMAYIFPRTIDNDQQTSRGWNQKLVNYWRSRIYRFSCGETFQREWSSTLTLTNNSECPVFDVMYLGFYNKLSSHPWCSAFQSVKLCIIIPNGKFHKIWILWFLANSHFFS